MKNGTILVKQPKLSMTSQMLYTAGAIIAAVAVPQLFHAVGILSGTGAALGKMFLPMHLPIIFAGLVAGPFVGAIAGLLGPVASFVLSGMPSAAILPFMMIELCAYGLFAGLLRSVNMPNIVKVITVQASGRVIYTFAGLIALAAFGNHTVDAASVWTSGILSALPGLILQWTMIPLILYRVKDLRMKK